MDQLLVSRYASKEMSDLFEPISIAKMWRRLWFTLAETEMEFGAPITVEQISALRECAFSETVDLARIAEIEQKTRHDVVAHLQYLCESCPIAAPILHLGATSSFITDNADNILHSLAMRELIAKATVLIGDLSSFASIHASVATIGYTHFQPAQAVTVGKRACLWLQDLIIDARNLSNAMQLQQCRGAKGTVGSQATYLALFGSTSKVEEFDKALALKLGFKNHWMLGGQTFSRKCEVGIADAIAGMSSTFNKMGTDIRLLSHTGELYEQFTTKQVGSSAMPYKRNPITSERLCSLARMLPHYRNIISEVASAQWLERSLDDSAARRLTWPNLFLTADSVLSTAIKLVRSLKVGNLLTNLDKHGPFMQSEGIIIKGVLNGMDRQELHETLLNYASQSDHDGNLFSQLIYENDELYGLGSTHIDTGMCEQQVKTFLADIVQPALDNLMVGKPIWV